MGLCSSSNGHFLLCPQEMWGLVVKGLPAKGRPCCPCKSFNHAYRKSEITEPPLERWRRRWPSCLAGSPGLSDVLISWCQTEMERGLAQQASCSCPVRLCVPVKQSKSEATSESPREKLDVRCLWVSPAFPSHWFSFLRSQSVGFKQVGK